MTVAGGEQRMLRQGFFEVVERPVMDVIMPDVNGPALFETLRAKNAGLKVLYISGYTKRTATRAGGLPDDAPFLQKPFPPEVLARHVRDVLDA